MTRRRTILVLALSAIVFAGIGTAYWLLRPTPLVLPPLPNPNGYEDFLAAARSIAYPERDPERSKKETSRAILALNAESLARIRVGLQRDSRVPLVDSPFYMKTALTRQSALSQLDQLLITEGQVAESDGDVARAIQSYTDVIKLGVQVAKGGMLTDQSKGLGFEERGLRQLRNLVPELTAQQCRELIAALERIEAGREPWDQAVQRERILFRNNAPPAVRLSGEFGRYVARAEDTRNRRQARFRLLLTHLALRAYHQEHETYPGDLARLVPEYLATVPEVAYSLTQETYSVSGGAGLYETGNRPAVDR